MSALDGDIIEAKARDLFDIAEYKEPTEKQLKQSQEALIKSATQVFTGELCDLIESIRRSHEQTIDVINIDKVTFAGWHGDSVDNAKKLIAEFADYLKEHKDEILVLSIFYDQPYRRRELTYSMIRARR